MKVFKSRIGLELVIPLSIVFGTEIFVFTYEKLGWIGIAILLPIILFVVHMLLTTYYTINENSLIIKCGFLYNMAIDINTIKKISETNNLISSPAASIDRIEIIYGNHHSVIISPKQKKEFIDCIVSLNPNVEVKYKKKKNETIK
jgi:hypothetical protein